MNIKHARIDTTTRLRTMLAAACLCLPAACGMASAEREADSAMTAEMHLIVLGEAVEFKTPEGGLGRTRQLLKIKLASPSPIPARALDPVIMIGERAVTEYRYIAANELEFTDYQPEGMKDGSEIYFQWGREAIPQQREKLAGIYDRKALRVVTEDRNAGND